MLNRNHHFQGTTILEIDTQKIDVEKDPGYHELIHDRNRLYTIIHCEMLRYSLYLSQSCYLDGFLSNHTPICTPVFSMFHRDTSEPVEQQFFCKAPLFLTTRRLKRGGGGLPCFDTFKNAWNKFCSLFD